MIRTSSSRRMIGVFCLCWVGLGLSCGGSKPEVKEPSAVQSKKDAGKPVVGESGAQVGITDAPSSGLSAKERPMMNASAKESYTKALEAFGQGDLSSAKKLFEDAIDKDPKAYQAHYSLGVILERLRDANALSEYKAAYRIVTDYEPAITAYGMLLARRGNLTEADQFLTERHAQMPKSAAVAAGLAEVKSMQRDTASAQKYAQEALKANPNYAPAMVALARDHFRNRRLDLARYALQAILDGFPGNPPRDKDNAEARLLRALILQEEGLRAAAIRELEVVLEKRPDLVEAGVQLATYYLESGNADKALPLLQRALRYHQDDVVAHLNLADCYRLLGKVSEARTEYQWVQTKDPAQIDVYYNLGLLYLFSDSVPGFTPLRQVSEAIKEFEKYKELRGRKPGEGGSDIEQLIVRAKAKKGMLEAEQNAAAPASPPATSAAKPVPPAAASSAPKPPVSPAGSAKPASS